MDTVCHCSHTHLEANRESEAFIHLQAPILLGTLNYIALLRSFLNRKKKEEEKKQPWILMCGVHLIPDNFLFLKITQNVKIINC